MTLETKLFSKLEPHAKRIKDGEGNDFDYLPAVLLQLLEEQKRQIQHLDDSVKLLDSIKSTVVSIGVASKTHIAAFEATAQSKMDQLEAAIKDTQTQIQSSQSHFTEQIFGIADAQAGYTTKIHEGLSAIGLQIESLDASSQRSQVKFIRILIAGLVASTVMIGLAIAILLRH
jgi:F0F1-type ATP synthase membrane subunit c/vacuolar-type H+-ATPase subunit K